MFFGALLIALGVAFWAVTSAPTALIPAAFGVLLTICGVIARNTKLRMHAMHGAALLGLLGAAFPLVRALPKLEQGNYGAAVIEQLLMAVLSLIFLVLCVRSFIAARRARKAAIPA
jgi:hypothetical protein